MTLILEAVVFGVLTGGVYALMASGLTLIFGVMRIINVGHGALVILGAYLSFALLNSGAHIDPFREPRHHDAGDVRARRCAAARCSSAR